MPPRIVAKPFFRPATEELRFLPECPRRLQGTNVLAWVAIQHGADVMSGSLNLLDLATLENRTLPLPGRPGFFVETSQAGQLLFGLERRLVLYDLAAERITATLAELPPDPRVIINDGTAVPDGVIFGTKDLHFAEPIAALYHYGRELRELHGGQTCSNGKYFHDDVLIDIDTQPKTITEYRYRSNGPLEPVRLITPPDRLPALPDGLRPTPDKTCIVVAYYNPAHVSDGLAQQIRIADGEVVQEWVVPGSPRVTCPEFLMLDGSLHVLFTTAVEGMPDATRAIAPEAGTMFIAPALH